MAWRRRSMHLLASVPSSAGPRRRRSLHSFGERESADFGIWQPMVAWSSHGHGRQGLALLACVSVLRTVGVRLGQLGSGSVGASRTSDSTSDAFGVIYRHVGSDHWQMIYALRRCARQRVRSHALARPTPCLVSAVSQTLFFPSGDRMEFTVMRHGLAHRTSNGHGMLRQRSQQSAVNIYLPRPQWFEKSNRCPWLEE